MRIGYKFVVATEKEQTNVVNDLKEGLVDTTECNIVKSKSQELYFVEFTMYVKADEDGNVRIPVPVYVDDGSSNHINRQLWMYFDDSTELNDTINGIRTVHREMYDTAYEYKPLIRLVHDAEDESNVFYKLNGAINKGTIKLKTTTVKVSPIREPKVANGYKYKYIFYTETLQGLANIVSGIRLSHPEVTWYEGQYIVSYDLDRAIYPLMCRVSDEAADTEDYSFELDIYCDSEEDKEKLGEFYHRQFVGLKEYVDNDIMLNMDLSKRIYMYLDPNAKIYMSFERSLKW